MISRPSQSKSELAATNSDQARLNKALIWSLFLVFGGSFAVLVLATTAPLWLEPAAEVDFLRSIGNLILDFLERFYHEPEMDII